MSDYMFEIDDDELEKSLPSEIDLSLPFLDVDVLRRACALEVSK